MSVQIKKKLVTYKDTVTSCNFLAIRTVTYIFHLQQILYLDARGVHANYRHRWYDIASGVLIACVRVLGVTPRWSHRGTSPLE